LIQQSNFDANRKTRGLFGRIGDILSQGATWLCRDLVMPHMTFGREKSCENFYNTPLDERNEDMIQFAQPSSEKVKSSGVKPGT
jgi:hypothetical protein